MTRSARPQALAAARERLGLAFRRRRLGVPLSQDDVAAAAGLLQKTLSHIETGAGDPALSSLLAAADALGCELRLVSFLGDGRRRRGGPHGRQAEQGA